MNERFAGVDSAPDRSETLGRQERVLVADAPAVSREASGDHQRVAPNHRINFGRRSATRWDGGRTEGANASGSIRNGLGVGLLRDARVLILDDCTLYREYLADIVAANGAMYTGVAWDARTLQSAFEDIVPRVILINMATRGSRDLLRQALLAGPDVRAVVVGLAEDDESEIVACAEAGVAGYHMRGDSLDELLHLVQRVADGESFCSPRVSAVLLRRLSSLASTRPAPPRELVLTAREAQILKMLELGLSNKDIATELHIAVHTVKNHVHSLLKKLGVSTRAQAAALARSTDLLGGDPKD